MQSERRNDRNVDNNKFSLCDYIVYAKTVMGGKWVCKKVSISVMLIYVFSPVGHNIYTFILVTKKTVQVQQLQLLLLFLLFTPCSPWRGQLPYCLSICLPVQSSASSSPWEPPLDVNELHLVARSKITQRSILSLLAAAAVAICSARRSRYAKHSVHLANEDNDGWLAAHN